MRVYISKHRIKILIWLPTCIFHWKWLWNKILSNANSIEDKEIMKLVPFIIEGCKFYKKKYGHFNLVNVKSKDGTIVKIKM